MSEAASAPAAARLPELDLARGLAVIGMFWVHFVPMEPRGAWPEQAAAAVSRALEGTPAALFFILAGMAWGLQAERSELAPRYPLYVARRALTLLLMGLALHRLAWSTEVLVPMGLALPACAAIRRGGPRALRAALLLVLIATPLLAWRIPTQDWNEDGSHAADRSTGWVTVRYLVLNGNYPLIPFLAFPLLGMVMVSRRGRPEASGSRPPAAGPALRATVGLATVAALARLAPLLAPTSGAAGGLAPYLACTWTPITLPFVFAVGSTALLTLKAAGRLRPVRLAPSITLIGRASLTHYLGHILLVFVPLRLAFPAEDWPARIGLAAFAGYAAAALPLTALWFRRFQRGPVEELLARASGRSR